MAPVEAEQHPRTALALAAHDASGRVSPIRISRRYAYAHALSRVVLTALAVARHRCCLLDLSLETSPNCGS
jgi:hypothetical protein